MPGTPSADPCSLKSSTSRTAGKCTDISQRPIKNPLKSGRSVEGVQRRAAKGPAESATARTTSRKLWTFYTVNHLCFHDAQRPARSSHINVNTYYDGVVKYQTLYNALFMSARGSAREAFESASGIGTRRYGHDPAGTTN